MSFSNSELLPNLSGWFRPLIGKDPYNKKSVDDSKAATSQVLKVLEQHFLVHTFLVGERLTLADLYTASQIARGFQYVLDKAWRSENPNTTRWYETIVNQPIWKAIVEQPILIEEAVKYTPPKKEPKPAKAAAPAAKKPAKEEEEEEEAKPEVKAKHPLEALPKPTLILDDWKRKYSNEETREVALPWFWEHYKPEEYSLWKVDYKYNDELTQVFMTSNLIGTFWFFSLLVIVALTLLQAVSLPVSRLPASICSDVARSMAKPMTLSSRVPSWCAVTRLFLLSMSPQTMKATNSPSLTQASQRTRPLSRTSGRGTSRLK